jgi:hypothetical protein
VINRLWKTKRLKNDKSFERERERVRVSGVIEGQVERGMEGGRGRYYEEKQ